MILHRKALTLAILTAMAGTAAASEAPATLEEMVVTGVRTDAPLNVSTNPKAPRQPVPAHDGADFLKTIPGFSVIRKGGADGDPIFRGMAGSRLSMLVDGETVLGGCGHRMDPPTAYIFPEAYDSIQVIKGPQSVQHGPGNSAGVVLFERNQTRPTATDFSLHSSVLAGNFGRHDEVLDATYTTPEFTVRASGTNAAQDDYQDGDGVDVHSEYQRWSTNLSLAWTPSDNTRLELTGARSDGEAAYADRGMDGTKFARDNYGVKFLQSNIGDVFKTVEVQAYHNYVDHVMDNYKMRDLATPATGRMVSNPDRETTGGKLVLGFAPSVSTDLTVGIDTQDNVHTVRNTMNQTMMPYQAMARGTDAEFEQTGVFAELGWNFGRDSRLIGGVRADDWQFTDKRQRVALSMMMSAPNPTAGKQREETLNSRFLRYETGIESIDSTFYVGVGHNERFPDYWELVSKESATTVSAFDVESEKLTQLGRGSGCAVPLRDELANGADPGLGARREQDRWPHAAATAATGSAPRPALRQQRVVGRCAVAWHREAGSCRSGPRQHRRPGHRRDGLGQCAVVQCRLASRRASSGHCRHRQSARQDLCRAHQSRGCEHPGLRPDPARERAGSHTVDEGAVHVLMPLWDHAAIHASTVWGTHHD